MANEKQLFRGSLLLVIGTMSLLALLSTRQEEAILLILYGKAYVEIVRAFTSMSTIWATFASGIILGRLEYVADEKAKEAKELKEWTKNT